MFSDGQTEHGWMDSMSDEDWQKVYKNVVKECDGKQKDFSFLETPQNQYYKYFLYNTISELQHGYICYCFHKYQIEDIIYRIGAEKLNTKLIDGIIKVWMNGGNRI